MVAQNWGLLEQLGNGDNPSAELDGVAAPEPVPPRGSLPKVLQGLPIGAGPVKSATADREMVAVGTPMRAPKVLWILLVTVTFSWLAVLPLRVVTVMLGSPLL